MSIEQQMYIDDLREQIEQIEQLKKEIARLQSENDELRCCLASSSRPLTVLDGDVFDIIFERKGK